MCSDQGPPFLSPQTTKQLPLQPFKKSSWLCQGLASTGLSGTTVSRVNQKAPTRGTSSSNRSLSSGYTPLLADVLSYFRNLPPASSTQTGNDCDKTVTKSLLGDGILPNPTRASDQPFLAPAGDLSIKSPGFPTSVHFSNQNLLSPLTVRTKTSMSGTWRTQDLKISDDFGRSLALLLAHSGVPNNATKHNSIKSDQSGGDSSGNTSSTTTQESPNEQGDNVDNGSSEAGTETVDGSVVDSLR